MNRLLRQTRPPAAHLFPISLFEIYMCYLQESVYHLATSSNKLKNTCLIDGCQSPSEIKLQSTTSTAFKENYLMRREYSQKCLDHCEK